MTARHVERIYQRALKLDQGSALLASSDVGNGPWLGSRWVESTTLNRCVQDQRKLRFVFGYGLPPARRPGSAQEQEAKEIAPTPPQQAMSWNDNRCRLPAARVRLGFVRWSLAKR